MPDSAKKVIITFGIHEITDFEINCKLSRALNGFGSAEMPPVIYGGKGEAKRRPPISGGVNSFNMIDLLSQRALAAFIDTVSLLGKRVEFW